MEWNRAGWKVKYEIKWNNGNGKGREYYRDGNLKFVVEYLNGKRNGKGKEYCDGKIIFEGEYLNGQRNGKGKEYDRITGKLIFEGEYLNEIRNGKGKEYDYNGNIKFEGEYLNGERIILKGEVFINWNNFENDLILNIWK